MVRPERLFLERAQILELNEAMNSPSKLTSERELKSSPLWHWSERLLSFDTVSSKSNSDCANFFANELTTLGFNVQLTQEPNGKHQVVASIGPTEENGLILSGHMDVVPFENQKGWTTDPLKLTLDQDKLYGRGTSDMKIFMAHCLQAFKDSDLKKLKQPIVCLFTCDEEIGCLGAKSLAPRLSSLLGKMPVPKKALIGEPTDFKIINSHKGMVIFEVILKGKAAHSSRPDWGVNAIMPAEKVIAATRRLNEKYHSRHDENIKKLFPDFPFDYLSLVRIQGGLADNVVPDECRMVFSYRPLPGTPLMSVYEELKSELGDLQDEIHFNHLISAPGLVPSLNAEMIATLKAVTKQTDLHAVSYTTDASYFSTQAIDCFICGGGSIEKAHQPNESMTLEHFLRGPEFVREVLLHSVF